MLAIVNALGRAGIALGENGSIFLRPNGTPRYRFASLAGRVAMPGAVNCGRASGSLAGEWRRDPYQCEGGRDRH
jgi:hypothetical protein